MSARATSQAPLTPLAELEPMVARAGLTLNAGQMADLALAWRQVMELLGRIPRVWVLADDQAFVFRLPPPGAGPVGAKAPPAPGRTAGKEVAKAPAKAAAKLPGTSIEKPPGMSPGKPGAAAGAKPTGKRTPAAPRKMAARRR